MTQKQKIKRLVIKHPGLTATQYTKLLDKKANRYKPASVLRELHRMTEELDGPLVKSLEEGQRKGIKAWRFYPAVLFVKV